MKRMMVLVLCGLLLLSGGCAVQGNEPTATADIFSVPRTHDVPLATVGVEQQEVFESFLSGLDTKDIHSGAAAVNKLDELYTEEPISDADVHALLTFLEELKPDNAPVFTGTVNYRERGMSGTDFTLDGMRVYYANYLKTAESEGMLYCYPDYVAIGTLLYDRLPEGYRAYFEMRFDLAFYRLERLYTDNVPALPQKDLVLAKEIMQQFEAAYPDLAERYGLSDLIERLAQDTAGYGQD